MAGRLAQVAAMMLLVVVLCFAAQHALPGDAAVQVAVARQGESAGDSGIERARQDGGFDRPVAVQFGAWLARLGRLDLGESLISRRPVAEELATRAAVTLRIGLLAVLVGLLLALPLGLAAGLRPGGTADGVVALCAALFVAIPPFLLGLLLVAVAVVHLGLLPAAGTGGWRHLVLPVVTLALGFAAPMSLIVRHAVADAWAAFPVTFGRLKGLSAARSGLRHGVRNAAIPVTVAAGLRLVAVLEGFVVVETLFNIPGLGDLLVSALVARDIPVVQGAALLFGLVYGAVGILLDVACVALDPRRRLGRAAA